MVEVVSLTTARDVWLALETTFGHRSKARELRLKDYLQLMKHGIQPMTEHAHAFKARCDQLLAIGRPVDDAKNCIGSSATFSTTQMALMPLPSFIAIVSKIKSFEIFQMSLEPLVAAPVAF